MHFFNNLFSFIFTLGCLTTQYRCVDGFCLDIEAIANEKPDCIDAKYTPELKYLTDHRILPLPEPHSELENKLQRWVCETSGWFDAGDYRVHGCTRTYADVITVCCISFMRII